MTVQEFKEFTKDIRKMTKLADKVEVLLSGANLLNSKSRLEQLVPMVKDLLLRFGKMKAHHSAQIRTRNADFRRRICADTQNSGRMTALPLF